VRGALYSKNIGRLVVDESKHHILQKKRLENVPDGVDYLIISCPLCTKNLIEGGSDADVLDLVELVRLVMSP